MSSVYVDIIDEMHRVINAAHEQKLLLRVVGGLAVRVHSANPQRFFSREYPDIDFVVERIEYNKLVSFFNSVGYLPEKQFNLLNGSRRQIYYDQNTGKRIDVFVGDFEMCHKLPLKGRLHHDPITIPLAELLLSKTQIVELNRKDAFDVINLILNNEVGSDDDGKINLKRIMELCLDDWGLYKTNSINLGRVEEIVRNEDISLSAEERELLLERIHKIQHALDGVEKPLAWKLRDRVGTRVRWYTEVEEVHR
ncbi:MAG: hypothetical protein HZB19_18910 [Chloroflexi bacterium]|nr:hypothetical protein [Chloroflexota bacterium]